MDFNKYHSQLIKDISHYTTRTQIGTILKAEQKEITEDSKRIQYLDVIIKLNKDELIKIEGKNNIYSFNVSIDGKDVYTTPKCNYRDEEFRNAIKDTKEYINFVNCFENLGKIFKKKRKK
ncbi:hypothetical protein UT300005_11460 [Clostridium sp. CTA-5]